MKKKILVCFFAILCICFAAHAQSQSDSTESPSANASAEEQFSFLLMNYFRDKNPNLVQVTVNFFRERQLVTEDMQMPLVGFYAELFRDKKIKDSMLKEIDSLKIKSVSNFFHSVAEFDLDKFYENPEANPNVNDMLWGSFFASGNTKYLDLVIDNAVKYHDEKTDLVKYLTGDSACWSLASNAQQYKEVREHLEKSRQKGEAVIDYILNTDPDEIRMNTIFFLQEQKKAGIWQ